MSFYFVTSVTARIYSLMRRLCSEMAMVQQKVRKICAGLRRGSEQLW